MKVGKKLKVAILAASFYLASLPVCYSEMQLELLRCEKRHGLETTLKSADAWLEKYDNAWYMKPFRFTRKWAVEQYLEDHDYK